MTACVNKRRALAAALAGVLALGGGLALAAPTVALAEGASAQFATSGGEFADAQSLTVSFVNAVNGTAVAGTDIDGVTTYAATDLPITYSTTGAKLKPAGNAGTVSVELGTNYRVRVWYAAADGTPDTSKGEISGGRVFEQGTYVITVEALDGAQYTGTYSQTFKVVPAQIPAVTAFENGDVSDTTFTYTGSDLVVGFKDASGNIVDPDNYTVSYQNSSTGKVTSSVKDAGTYNVILTGKGIYDSTSSTSLTLTVGAFNLNGATITVAPFVGTQPTTATTVTSSDGKTQLDPSSVAVVWQGSASLTTSGTVTNGFKLVVSPNANVTVANGNTSIVNGTSKSWSADGSRMICGADSYKADVIGGFSYNGAALADSYDVYPGHEFDVSAVKATVNGSVVSSITVTSDVTPVTSSAAAGTVQKVTFTYWASVTVGTSSKWVAGTKTVTLHVYYGAIDADTQLYVFSPDRGTSSGSAVYTNSIDSYAKGYDGKYLAAGSFLVVNKDRTVSNKAAADTHTSACLDVVLKDASGNVVDTATAAGEYTLEVSSDKYLLSGTTTMKVTIEKVDLTTARVGTIVKWNAVAGEEYVPMNNQVVNSSSLAVSNLGLVYATGHDGAAYNETGYAADDLLGEDLIEGADVVVQRKNSAGQWVDVAKIDKAGEYQAVISVGSNVASNFVLPEGKTSVTLPFDVAVKGSFSDVQPSDWYYQYVEQAYLQDYMNGYTGTTSFGPTDSLTRGQACIVLMNMSGARYDETDAGYSKNHGWMTGFADVDGTAYYAKAIYWAAKNGIVTGYMDGNFGPEDTVTREQFATMLARYAQVVNRDESVAKADGTSLAKMSDASSVDSWAASSVDWCVSKGLMGANGTVNPTDNVERAQVAKMVVTYQPSHK